MIRSANAFICGTESIADLGTPSNVSSWKRYVIMDPIFGGFLRCLSLNPVPTLNVYEIVSLTLAGCDDRVGNIPSRKP